jgi:hypothetical protein
MSAISQTSLPITSTLFRSLLPRDQRLRIPDSNRSRPRRESSVLRLIVHFVLTSIVFLLLTTFVWMASLMFHVMQSVYPFSDEMFQALHRLELFLLYADAATTAVILLNAIVRYVVAALEGHS